MRGRRTSWVLAVVTALCAWATTACEFGGSAGPQPSADATLVAVDDGGAVPPELRQPLSVELGTAVAVFGLGCRPQSSRQRCSGDGEKTYTLTGALRAATVRAAWMQLDRGGRWAVHLRLSADDQRAATQTADRARLRGGLVVLLDAHTGDVLQAVSPNDVHRGRITRSDLHRMTAESVVSAFIRAAERR